MRKIMVIAYTLVTSQLYANFICPNACPFEGCYVGASLGIATNMAETRAQYQALFDTEFGQNSSQNDIKVDACNLKPWGELYAGYGLRCGSCFYVGGRVSVNFTKRKVQIGPLKNIADLATDEFRITLSDEVTSRLNAVEGALDLKLGLIFCENTMFFGMIGVAFNNAKISSDTNYLFEGVTIPEEHNVVLRNRKNEFSPGFRLGFGIERLLCSCLGLHVTYLYTWYRDQHVKGVADTISFLSAVTPNGLTSQDRVRNRHQVLTVGLSYYF